MLFFGMIEKTIKIFMVFIIAVYSFFSSYAYVEAKDEYASQPAVCNWPSEMMSNYFDFQRKAIKILLWSDVNSIRFSTTFDNWWLFTDKVLTLKWVAAIDILATNALWNTKSFVSNSLTSIILLWLVSVSFIQSNTEWFAILFKDRPIVRDYKTMLDIETNLFDVAYFRSKQIDLTQPFQSDLLAKFADLIEEYQKKWLLEMWVKLESANMADIIIDLFNMNTYMKHFITINKKLWKKALENYNWCMWKLDVCERSYWGELCCNRKNSILKFSTGAINTLYEDYKGLAVFWKCNLHAKYFKSTISKTIKNNKESVKSAMDDIADSMKRLKWVFVSTYKAATTKEKNRCDLSDYEMAQLQAYWWWNWNCNVWLLNTDMSITNTRNYFNEKIAQREQKEKVDNKTKKSTRPESKDKIMWDVVDKISEAVSTNERENIRYSVFWSDVRYNSSFSNQLNSDFMWIFQETMDKAYQAQENAIASDISDLFLRANWILKQLDTTMNRTKNLEEELKKIEVKQCSG